MIEMHIFHGQRTHNWNWNSVHCDHVFRLMKCRRDTYKYTKEIVVFSQLHEYDVNILWIHAVHISQKIGNFHRIITTIHLRQQFWINDSNESHFIWCLIFIKFILKAWHFLPSICQMEEVNRNEMSPPPMTASDDIWHFGYLFMFIRIASKSIGSLQLASVLDENSKKWWAFCTIK